MSEPNGSRPEQPQNPQPQPQPQNPQNPQPQSPQNPQSPQPRNPQDSQSSQPRSPQYGAYDNNHGGQYPPQSPQSPQYPPQPPQPSAQSQGQPTGQNPYGGPYATNPNGRQYAPSGQPYQPYQPNSQSGWQFGQAGQQGRPGQQGQPGQPNQNQGGQQGRQYAGASNPFRLIEEWLPDKAKSKIRVIYGVVGVAAVALGAALLFVPTKTLALAALLLGIYFVISGVIRIVSALVEPGLPIGWRVLDIFIGILLALGGVVVVKNYGLSGQTMALLITFMVGFGWIMEGVMSLVESWRIPHSGWGVAYAIISIVAGFVVLMSPLSSTAFLIIFGGCAMVVMGITAIVRAFTFGRRRK
jgi:uncharacterized membrane protein HdeD (DUF308 family)